MRIVQLENEITARIEDINKDYIPKPKIRQKIETTKKECEKCRFKESGICEELNKNNQCTQGTILNVLKQLLEEK